MKNLKNLNTFSVEAYASEIIPIRSIDGLRSLTFGSVEDYLILGGGSNILFTGDLDRVVLKNEIRGFEIIADDVDSVVLRVGGGELWHDVVMWACGKDLGGIENLALIPGTAGAAPIQNIGAYGVEFADVCEAVNAFDLAKGQELRFAAEDCDFGYRSSVFKEGSDRGRFFIHSVDLRLSKPPHVLVTDYGRIAGELEGVGDPTIRDLADAVIAIRSSKLPDPAVLGNAGSFFKNPIVTVDVFEQVCETAGRSVDGEAVVVPSYPAGFDTDGTELVKIPAGWLVESLGWKGKRVGATGTYENQALIIVNHGNATGSEIWDHAQRIQASVLDRYGIRLEPEVNII